MKCDNRLCVYEKSKECTCPDKIEIDWRGLCKNMKPVRITTEELKCSKFYSGIILKCGDYQFDNETGEYVCVDKDLIHYSVD